MVKVGLLWVYELTLFETYFNRRMLTNIFLTVTQFGFCCVYVVFLSDHIVQVSPSVM